VLSARVKDVAPDAIAAALLAESRTSKGDEAGARKALEKAAEAGPSFAGVQLQLALIHQEAGNFPEAAKRYRLVLETQPENAVALNNLAFGLAVDMKSPEEARPYALRASALAPKDLYVLDTLAWIEHLLGNHAEAARLIAKVTAGIPNHLESRLHAAFIYAAVERWKEADAELQAALKLDAGITTRPEVRELQARISERLAKIKQ
jgi:Tfp pilus assembly protein PilF